MIVQEVFGIVTENVRSGAKAWAERVWGAGKGRQPLACGPFLRDELVNLVGAHVRSAQPTLDLIAFKSGLPGRNQNPHLSHIGTRTNLHRSRQPLPFQWVTPPTPKNANGQLRGL
jgi:hypothetical protein